jgi:hypothetical protein
MFNKNSKKGSNDAFPCVSSAISADYWPGVGKFVPGGADHLLVELDMRNHIKSVNKNKTIDADPDPDPGPLKWLIQYTDKYFRCKIKVIIIVKFFSFKGIIPRKFDMLLFGAAG